MGAPLPCPPYTRHTRFPFIAGERHDRPERALTWQRGALDNTFGSMGLAAKIGGAPVDVLMVVDMAFIPGCDFPPTDLAAVSP